MSDTSNLYVSGVERFFEERDIIVSKTDLKGRILYANKIFIDISGYTEEELLGQPHSILRHPSMPRCVFNLMWSTIQDGREIFAYVINRCKNGDHYWVLAHVTPSYDTNGTLTGYHSNRRVPDMTLVREIITPLYAALLKEENKHSNRKEGMHAGTTMMGDVLKQKGLAYDEFVFSL